MTINRGTAPPSGGDGEIGSARPGLVYRLGDPGGDPGSRLGVLEPVLVNFCGSCRAMHLALESLDRDFKVCKVNVAWGSSPTPSSAAFGQSWRLAGRSRPGGGTALSPFARTTLIARLQEIFLTIF